MNRTFGLDELTESVCREVDVSLALVQGFLEEGDIAAALEEIKASRAEFAVIRESAEKIVNAYRMTKKADEIEEETKRVREKTDKIQKRTMFLNLSALGIMLASLLISILFRVLR